MMFTEEQAGNPAKKRADDAKARRLRAKREKDAKEQRKTNELVRRERESGAAAVDGGETSVGGAAAVKEDNNAYPTISAEILSRNCQSASQAGMGVKLMISKADSVDVRATASASAAPSEPISATQKAAEQRKLRAEARARVTAATVIQSMVRSKLVARKAREDQRAIFDKRMSDLIALSGILKQSTRADYVPPPATVSVMSKQFLFFACPVNICKRLPGANGHLI